MIRIISKSNIVISILIALNCIFYLKDPENPIEDIIRNSEIYVTTGRMTEDKGRGRLTPSTKEVIGAVSKPKRKIAKASNMKTKKNIIPNHSTIKQNSFLLSSIMKAKERELNFSRLVDIEFKYLITPKCRKDLLLIVVVSSKPSNLHRRVAIRRTWGRCKDVMQVVFAMGTWNKTFSNKKTIQDESNFYGDIVQGNFVDSYRNLTYKHLMGLQWVTQQCSTSRFFLKTDDDVFVHYEELVWFLTREFYDWGNKNAMACALQTGVPVVRSKTDFWYVTEEEYAGKSYPPFCSGSFILYAPEVLPLLIQESQTAKYFYVDDVFVTGLLTERLNFTQINLDYLFLNKQKYRQLMQKGGGEVGTFLTGPENVDVDEVYSMWRLVNKYYKDSMQCLSVSNTMAV